MSEIASIEGLREWLKAKLPPEACEALDLSNLEIRPETVSRIGSGTEGFIGKVLNGEWRARKDPDSLLTSLNNLLTCRTHFRYLEEVLRVSGTNSLSEAFTRFTVISPSNQPTGDTLVVGTPGQRIKEGYYQVFNRENPALGTLFFGKKAFVHLYELFAGVGALEEKEKRSKEREKVYEANLKEVLLGEKEPSSEERRVEDSWLIKERQELLTKLRAEVEVAKSILDKLGYVPSGIFPEADRAFLENDAGGGLLGWLKREKENLPPHAKEALDLLLDKYVDLEDSEREFLLHSVFTVSQAIRYIDKHFALSDIESDMNAYMSERGSIPPAFAPLQRIFKSDSKIITQLELQLIGSSGIIEYRRERNESLFASRKEEISSLLDELIPLMKDENGKFFDDTFGRGVPGRLKTHLYFRPITAGRTVISKDEFFALREISQFYKGGAFSWHLVGTYSIESFEKMVNAASLAARKVKYLDEVLKEHHLGDKPKDPPPDVVISLKGELLTKDPSLAVIDSGMEECLKRYGARKDLAPRFQDSASKLRALKCGLRESSFTDDEYRTFSRTMKELISSNSVQSDLLEARWLLSRKLISDDSFSDLPKETSLYISKEEARRIRSLATYGRIRRKLYPTFSSDESNTVEEELLKRRKELSSASFIVHRISNKTFKIENHDVQSLSKAQSLSGTGGRYAGLSWRENIGEISYLDPILLERDLGRVESDFIRIDPPFADSEEFKTLKLLTNTLGVARLRALGYEVDMELWRKVPSTRSSNPIYVGREFLKFIDEIVKVKSRAVNQHFAVGEGKVIFTFSKEYAGKDLFDVATESPDQLKGFYEWMKKNRFPSETTEVVEMALKEGATRGELFAFAWERGTENLVELARK